ncbi:MAG TPA: hypothetical protein VN947_34180 [Polyangia bacterium]|nr:hypothetical protein [Polyangia bacterium]
MRSLVVMLILILTAATAHGGNEAKLFLRRGMDLYREASYAESVAMLEHARARGGLEPAERVECSFYLAAGYVALGSTAAARRELRAVLRDAPDYELPQYTSPKVAALFREVREELENTPRLKPLPPERHGDALALRFEASRTGGPAFGVVQWRWRGQQRWREAPLRHDGELLVADVTVEHSGALEYYAEGRAPGGALAAGSATQPLELPVVVGATLSLATEPPPPSRARKLWWLWTGIGAVGAAGLGVGLYFALRPQPSTADAVFDFQVH